MAKYRLRKLPSACNNLPTHVGRQESPPLHLWTLSLRNCFCGNILWRRHFAFFLPYISSVFCRPEECSEIIKKFGFVSWDMEPCSYPIVIYWSRLIVVLITKWTIRIATNCGQPKSWSWCLILNCIFHLLLRCTYVTRYLYLLPWRYLMG